MERKYTAYILMGYPGSGKSSLASKLINEGLVYESHLYSLCNCENMISLSSDDLREELYGFRDQTHNKEVFEELYKRAIEHSSEGDVIIDSTALTRKDRLRVIEKLKKFYNLELICVLAPIDSIFRVNGMRTNSKSYIPVDVLQQIISRFQVPTYEEGWEEIHFVYNDPCLHYSLSKVKYTFYNQIDSLKFNLNKHEDFPHDNPHHSETIKEHIDFVLSYVPYILERIAYYHDLGKFYVRSFNEEKGYHQYLGHAAVSTYIYLTDALLQFYLNWVDNGLVEEGELWETIDFNPYYIYSRDIKNHFKREERCMCFFNHNEDFIIGSRLSDLYSLYDNAFLTEIYAIYYHDQPYTCNDRDFLIKSLSKPSKYLINIFGEHLGDFVDILLEFNEYDRMREDKDE